MYVPIYLDLECIPAQDETLKQRIVDSITPPGNYKRADSIATWEQDSKPALVDETYRKACFDALTGQIVCISWAIGDDEISSVYQSHNERELLLTFFAGLQWKIDDLANNAGAYRIEKEFIGHNIAAFDLPYIWRRACLLKMRPPPFWPHPSIAPWKAPVFDTMIEWAGSRGSVKLDTLCQAFGIPGKDGMDGSQVYDYWLAGRHDEIEAYCRDDVMRVRELHKRMTFAIEQTEAF